MAKNNDNFKRKRKASIRLTKWRYKHTSPKSLSLFASLKPNIEGKVDFGMMIPLDQVDSFKETGSISIKMRGGLGLMNDPFNYFVKPL